MVHIGSYLLLEAVTVQVGKIAMVTFSKVKIQIPKWYAEFSTATSYC